jgi:hypothetical protein
MVGNQRKDVKNMSSKRTPPQAWFRNPTEETVLYNETLRERQAQRINPKIIPTKPENLVYIASPFRGDTKHNAQNAVSYCKFAVAQGKMPVAPHIWLPQFLDDNDELQRKLALDFGLWLVGQCSQLWVFGDYISEGMRGEIAEAKRLRRNVRYFTDAEIKQRRILR